MIAPGVFDAIVVGAGPVGASAAEKLVAAGMRVLMLDSGPMPTDNRFALLDLTNMDTEPWSFEPWKYETQGDDLELNRLSLRMVGGSATAWGAVCPRFLVNDFNMKSAYGVGVDWPFSYDDLERWYCDAEDLMGVSGAEDNPWAGPRSKPFSMPNFPMNKADLVVKEAGEKLGIHFHSIPAARNTTTYDNRSKCTNYGNCRICPSGALYSSEHTVNRLLNDPQFTLMTNTRARRIEVGEDGAACAVHLRDSDGVDQRVEGRRIILCAQGIENVRLLLHSKSEAFPEGLANRGGQVGRYLMEHPKFYYTGRVKEQLDPYSQGYETCTTLKFHDHKERGQYCGGRLLIRENSGPSPHYMAMKSGLWGRALKEEVRNTFGHFITMGAFLEQLPYKENRIELSETLVNDDGDPAAAIHFTLMRDYETRGYKQMVKIMESLYRKIGATKVRSIMKPSISGHYMGCHRISHDPALGPTNTHCETHEVKRLYLCGNGSFPTGGISNPTLTAVALSLKMADAIIREHQV